MAAAKSEVVVVMFPFPEYGHQIPLLRLSQLISSYNISVHYISIGARNRELKQRQKGHDDQFTNIHFHDLSISPNVNDDYWESFRQISEPLYAICVKLSAGNCKRVVIIHDALVRSVVQRSYSLTNVEAYFFHAIPAFTIYSLFKQISDDHDDDDNNEEDLLIPSLDSCYRPGMREFMKVLRDCKFKSGEIFNTCREIEGPYLDALSEHFVSTPLWSLGPFNSVHVGEKLLECYKTHRCIQWLDTQPLNSVILVSFGTANTFSLEQIHMIAMGLEMSDQKFIWVLREADKKGENVTSLTSNIELPIGFEQRVSERGIIAREWVPQLEILAHPSTGGYFFHSGWNSFLESATMGVPMATLPLNSDNPFNDVLITKLLKVGLVVRDWAHKHELVKADTIEVAVRTLMTSPEGEEMRQRATELSKAIKMSIGDGGSTHKEMDSFIAHITR